MPTKETAEKILEAIKTLTGPSGKHRVVTSEQISNEAEVSQTSIHNHMKTIDEHRHFHKTQIGNNFVYWWNEDIQSTIENEIDDYDLRFSVNSANTPLETVAIADSNDDYDKKTVYFDYYGKEIDDYQPTRYEFGQILNYIIWLRRSHLHEDGPEKNPLSNKSIRFVDSDFNPEDLKPA